MVRQVQFSQARFVTGDRDVATKSPTSHTADRYAPFKKNGAALTFMGDLIEKVKFDSIELIKQLATRLVAFPIIQTEYN